MRKLNMALGWALLFPLAAMAQYEGAPMQKTQEEKKVEQTVRRDKYPHSDNDWENFDVDRKSVV